MGWKAVTREPLAQCAHLGLAEDPFRRGAHAMDEHRCYAHMGRERIDLAHQKRFCLTSAHGSCPFLLVNAREKQRDWRTEARGWWRKVSPAYQALTATQLGRVVELGAAVAMRAYPIVKWVVLTVAALVLQTWRHIRPQQAPTVVEESAELVVAEPYQEDFVEIVPAAMAYEEPIAIVEPEPVAIAQGETAREWFWRAKNAETLDDLVHCLERASALDPANEMIATNLEWAKERRQAAKAKPPRVTAPTQPALYSAHKTSPIKEVGTALVNTVRTAVAFAAIAAGVVVVVGALPVQIRSSVQTPIDLPDTSGLVTLVHVPLGGGYDLGMALPYALGFLALFVGMGLLQREPSLAGRR